MDIFEQYLRENLPRVSSFHPHFEEALGRMLLAGGKRFRPQLLLAVVRSYEPLLVQNALRVALALEMLHTYSLIHDDLPAMDNAPLRREIPTLHVAFDEATAILVGDGLNTHAFYLIATAPLSSDVRIELVKELSDNGGIGGMVLGQAIDCYFENRPLGIDELTFLHLHKTAKLIAASLKMGAIIAGLEAKERQKLYDFGLNVGLLFQIQDDILDVTQSSQEAGKTTKRDINKNSFVNLLGLEGAMGEADTLAGMIKEEAASFDEALQKNLIPLIVPYLNRHSL